MFQGSEPFLSAMLFVNTYHNIGNRVVNSVTMILAEVCKIHRYIRWHTCLFYCSKPLNVLVFGHYRNHSVFVTFELRSCRLSQAFGERERERPGSKWILVNVTFYFPQSYRVLMLLKENKENKK